MDRKKIQVAHLAAALNSGRNLPKDITVTIQAEKNVPYGAIKDVLHKLSLANIGKIEFSALKGSPDPLQKD